nr:hypothetical protein Iba_chr01eCG6030 [Ipomoea batatas]
MNAEIEEASGIVFSALGISSSVFFSTTGLEFADFSMAATLIICARTLKPPWAISPDLGPDRKETEFWGGRSWRVWAPLKKAEVLGEGTVKEAIERGKKTPKNPNPRSEAGIVEVRSGGICRGEAAVKLMRKWQSNIERST